LKKRFISNLFLLIVLNLLIKPFWFFGIEVGVQNRVGEESYGFYFSLFSFAFILNMLLDVGVNNYNNRAISRNHGLLKENLAAIVPLKWVLFIIYAAVVLLSGKLLGYSPEQFSMLWILVLNQFLASFIFYFRSNISGLQYFRTDSLLSVLDRSLMILFTGLLLWGNFTREAFKIEWFVYAQTASYLITLLVTASIVFYRSGNFLRKVSVSASLRILKLSYPFALLILLMALFNRVDSVMLERLLENGREQAGIYAQSFRIFEAATQFSFLFAILLLPMFSRMIEQKQDVNALVRIAQPLLLTAGLAGALSCNFYKEDIITLLYDSHASYSSTIFGWLMIAFLFASLTYLYGTLLTANNNLRQLNVVAAITVLINVTLNLILIPRHQARGAAVASLVSQAFFAMCQWVVAIQLLGISWNRDILIRLLAFLGINLIVGYLSLMIPGWIPGFLLLLSSCVISAILLGLIRIAEFLAAISD
jgi:O-antigen/teichoic acid export membrane protein